VWVIIIIVITVALALGPVMMLRPTAGQKRLSTLRACAHEKGLRVRLESDPRKQKEGQLAVYTLPWCVESKKKGGSIVEWMLIKQSFSHELHFSGEWDWMGKGRAPKSSHQNIKTLLSHNPVNMLALSASRLGLGVYWKENLGGKSPQVCVEEISSILQAIESQLKPVKNAYT